MTKAKFSQFLSGDNSTTTSASSAKSITSALTSYIVNLSAFEDMKDEEVYEQLYVWEAEVGGAIDRVSTMAREAFKGCHIRYPGQELEDIEKEMLEAAELIIKELKIHDLIESYIETLYTQGNLFLIPNTDSTLSQLPNKYCAIVDESSRVGTYGGNYIMLDPKILIFNEDDEYEMNKKTYNAEKFIHLKYKDTPVFIKDNHGRESYGFYSISPIHRTVLPVWWKRQIMIVDILLRWRNVPREHHSLNSEMFSLGFYQGTPEERLGKSRTDAERYIASYIETIADLTPDSGYVTTDSVDIEMIESNVTYIESNELINQLDSRVTAGLNVPRSIIDGENAGSYASELVISNYFTSKVLQLCYKVSEPLVTIVRERLLAVNSSYPVQLLDFKFEINLSTNELEMWRQGAIMADLGVFTENEIRDKLGYPPIREEQREFIVGRDGIDVSKTVADIRDQGGMAENPDYPMTEGARESTLKDASSKNITDKV